jgi:hypothetical protein
VNKVTHAIPDGLSLIIWEDIHAWTQPWDEKKAAIRKAKKSPAIAMTVGFIIDSSDEHITITETILNRTSVGFYHRIPMGCIKEIKELDVREPNNNK